MKDGKESPRSSSILIKMLMVCVFSALMVLGLDVSFADNVHNSNKASDKDIDIVYTLDWKELARLADMFGFKLDERGMGIYVFTKGKTVFGLSMPTDLDTGHADSPLELTYYRHDGSVPIRARLDLSRGTQRRVIDDFFRRFIRRIELTQ